MAAAASSTLRCALAREEHQRGHPRSDLCGILNAFPILECMYPNQQSTFSLNFTLGNALDIFEKRLPLCLTCVEPLRLKRARPSAHACMHASCMHITCMHHACNSRCVPACMRACTQRAYIHTNIHTHIHTYIRTYVHTFMYICTYVHTCIHAYICAHMHACVAPCCTHDTCLHACIQHACGWIYLA